MSKFGNLKLNSDAVARMYLTDPVSGLDLQGDDGTKAWIDLYSSDSAVAREFDRRLLEARSKSRTPPTPEQLEEQLFRRAAELTKGWNLVDREGKVLEVPCNHQNALELYKELPWALEQALDFSRNRANYA